jgi:hypothetical protein
MQWTIKSFTQVDLFDVCAVLVAGVVIQSLEMFQRMKKQLPSRIGNLRSKH